MEANETILAVMVAVIGGGLGAVACIALSAIWILGKKR